jgi:glucosyl-3-phosphoglycerate synthase
VLTRLGDRPGKGEALWKALLVTSGDIIAFIDADLCDFDPQFVVGLVGPLLTDPGTGFVKGFYDRPLATGGHHGDAGGGRVTEMLARPLLNLHYPELAGLVQPLAGEYAARRSLLESIPFVSGYGVEIAMLLDVLHTVGVDSLAQVDLGVRRHRNSSDTLLGQMAAQVYLAFLSRLERHGAAVFAEEPTGEITQFTRHGDRFLPTTVNVAVTERPPMRTVAEYLQRHNREPQEHP